MFKRVYRRLAAIFRLRALAQQNPQHRRIIQDVRATGLSFLGAAALLDLYDAVRTLETRGIAGNLLETGTALGGSGLVLAAAKTPARALFLYDVFGLIPPPSSQDGEAGQQRYEQIHSGQATGLAGGTYYGYQADLLAQVQQTFQRFGFEPEQAQIHFVQGLYEESLQVDAPVALAHIDCDWYESVKVCLERIVPHLVPGGILVLDDYHQWPGCKLAVDEFFAGRQDEFIFRNRARLHIIRR